MRASEHLEKLKTDKIQPILDDDGYPSCRGSGCPSYEEGKGWTMVCSADGRAGLLQPCDWEDCAPFTRIMAKALRGLPDCTKCKGHRGFHHSWCPSHPGKHNAAQGRGGQQ